MSNWRRQINFIQKENKSIYLWVMKQLKEILMDALRVLMDALTFYWKMIKKLISLIVFYIFHESGVKTFPMWFINNCPKNTYKHFHM